PVTIQDLNSKKFILNNWGDTFLEWFMEFTGINYLPALSMNQTAIVLKMVEEQDYFTLLPSMISQSFIHDKQLYYLESELEMPTHHIYIHCEKYKKRVDYSKNIRFVKEINLLNS